MTSVLSLYKNSVTLGSKPNSHSSSVRGIGLLPPLCLGVPRLLVTSFFLPYLRSLGSSLFLCTFTRSPVFDPSRLRGLPEPLQNGLRTSILYYPVTCHYIISPFPLGPFVLSYMFTCLRIFSYCRRSLLS